MNKKTKILIVEDESIIAFGMKTMLKNKGYDVLEIASTADEAVLFAQKYKPDVILMDILLKGGTTGIDAAIKILSKNNIPIIYITGITDYKNDEKLRSINPAAIIIKPPTELKLLKAIENTL